MFNKRYLIKTFNLDTLQDKINKSVFVHLKCINKRNSIIIL